MFAPIATASVNTTTKVRPGALSKPRNATRTSCIKVDEDMGNPRREGLAGYLNYHRTTLPAPATPRIELSVTVVSARDRPPLHLVTPRSGKSPATNERKAGI